MARYKLLGAGEATLNITSLQQLKDYEDVQMEIHLAVSLGNDDAQVIRLLNTIPTLATLFKGTLGVGDIISTLGGYAEEAADKQKKEFLDGLRAGYKFFGKQIEQWDSNFVSMKLKVPMIRVVDTKTKGEVKAIYGTGYVYSKTDRNGLTFTM